MMPLGEFPNLILEASFRLIAHADGKGGDVKAEEVKAIAKGGDSGFLRAKLQPEFLLNAERHCRKRLFRLTAGFAQDHEIIRVADEVKSERIQLPVEMIEDDIGQKGRNYPALGRSLACGQNPAVLHHARLKELPDQTQDIPVGNLRRNQVQDERMRDVVKETLNIGIQHHPKSLITQLNQLRQRRMATATFPKAMGVIVKVGLEDRIDQLTDHLLRHSTTHGRDSQWAHFATPLGNIDPPQRQRLVGTGLERTHQRIKVLLQIGFEHRDGLLVDTGCATIATNRLERLAHPRRIDPARQRVSA